MDWQTVLWTVWMVIFTPTFLLVKILYWPVRILCNVILTLLSPVFYTVQYCLSPFVYVYNVLPRLQVCDGNVDLVGSLNYVTNMCLQPLYLYVSLIIRPPRLSISVSLSCEHLVNLETIRHSSARQPS